MHLLVLIHYEFQELPLILRVDRKRKETSLRYLLGDSRYREQDWSVGLGATLGDGHKI